MRFVVATALALLAVASLASTPRLSKPMSECAQHLPYGQPASAREDVTAICREGYALLHDNHAKIPVWVSYVLTPQEVLGCAVRTSDWDPDPSLYPGKRAEPRDYAKSGFDIGHMANSADMRWDVQVEIESNTLSNAAPQRPALNRGPWRQLEDQVRAWVLYRSSAIVVYVGPIYSASGQTIGPNRVLVPHAFWKVLVDQKTNQVLAFIYPAEAARGQPEQFRTTVAEVQRQTGVTLPLPKTPVFSSYTWASPSKTAGKERATACPSSTFK